MVIFECRVWLSIEGRILLIRSISSRIRNLGNANYHIRPMVFIMVAHFTLRTDGVNRAFRFAEGIRLPRRSRQFRNFSRKRHILHHTCSTCSELPSYISTVIRPVSWNKGRRFTSPGPDVTNGIPDPNISNYEVLSALIFISWFFLVTLLNETEEKCPLRSLVQPAINQLQS